MITKVVHGWRPAGLLAYLLGPGSAEVHRAPRVIASWDGLDADWQPASTGPGEYDLALGPLITALHAPAVAAGLPTRAPAEQGKRGYVWHCSARVATTDRVLSDGEWAGIARELLDGAGIAKQGDAGGPRWVAVRHAEDHIHIAAVLVRQDTSRRFWPHHDYPKLRAAARRIEQRLGLTVTAAPDGSAAPRPSRGEIEKAGGRAGCRRGWSCAAPPSRLRSPRLTSTVSSPTCRSAVTGWGCVGHPRAICWATSSPGRGDVTAAGEPVFYSGSKLAPDLSLPRLQQRWACTPSSRTPGDAGREPGASEVLEAVAAARAALRAGGEDGDGIASATADLLTALAAGRGVEGWGERWGTAADRFDRAARSARRTPARAGSDGGAAAAAGPRPADRAGSSWAGRGRWGGVGGGAGRAGGRDRRLAGRPRPRPPGRRGPPQRYGRDRARPRAPARRTARPDAERGWGERPGTGHATAAWRVGAIRPPAEQRAHHDPID